MQDTDGVLIETLWNVKNKQLAQDAWPTEGFNRNIVECKVVLIFLSSSFTRVLIETLWNVKRSEQVKRCGNAVVLIETLWNVKGKGRVHRHDIARF